MVGNSRFTSNCVDFVKVNVENKLHKPNGQQTCTVQDFAEFLNKLIVLSKTYVGLNNTQCLNFNAFSQYIAAKSVLSSVVFGPENQTLFPN